MPSHPFRKDLTEPNSHKKYVDKFREEEDAFETSHDYEIHNDKNTKPPGHDPFLLSSSSL